MAETKPINLDSVSLDVVEESELHKLVVQKTFVVNNVISQTDRKAITPSSEIRYGGKSPEYETGFTQRLVLEVSTSNEIPTKTLTFEGHSIVQAGDSIFAKIPMFIELGNRYSARDQYNETETAIELDIRRRGKSVRTDRAVGYERFKEMRFK